MVDQKEHRTDNLGLAPFLQAKGLRYIRSEITLGKYDKPVVVFVFEDHLGLGKDLELEFMRSDEKKYRDLLFFFRNEIEKLKRQVDHLNLREAKRTDDRFNVEE